MLVPFTVGGPVMSFIINDHRFPFPLNLHDLHSIYSWAAISQSLTHAHTHTLSNKHINTYSIHTANKDQLTHSNTMLVLSSNAVTIKWTHYCTCIHNYLLLLSTVRHPVKSMLIFTVLQLAAAITVRTGLERDWQTKWNTQNPLNWSQMVDRIIKNIKKI